MFEIKKAPKKPRVRLRFLVGPQWGGGWGTWRGEGGGGEREGGGKAGGCRGRKGGK